MRPSRPVETAEEKSQREYRERTKNISADRLVPYELYSLRLAIAELSANLGKRTALVELALQQGLAAVALAASTPEDNSAVVQEKIDKLTSQLTQIADEEEEAIKQSRIEEK